MAAYPGNYAVPGSMWPGAAWPGQPVPGTTAAWYVFNGPVTLIYPDYIDAAQGHTLVAAPGAEFDILTPPPGSGLPMPPDTRWSAVIQQGR